MEVLIVIAALHSVDTHTVDRDLRYESYGFLTADWTQKVCAASSGSIIPNMKGNKKCCNVPDAHQDDFNGICKGLKAGNFPNFHPLPSR
ncbi:hypothetical protein PHMEG_00018169, partial [Phytophthora megakarya]